MADYNSSLPVRTEDAGDVIIKIADSLVPSQQAQVTAARELSVLSSAQPGVDIGDVTVNNGAGAAAVNIQDGGNSITVDATDLDIRDLNSATDSVTVVATDLDIRDLSSATDSVTVVATDLDIRDLDSATDSVTVIQGTDPWNENIAQIAGAVPSATNALPSQLTDGTSFYDARQIRSLTAASDNVAAWISDATGAPFSLSNPLPVVEVGSPGAPINDYKDAASIAAGASDNHDYTVSGGVSLYLSQIEASASGKAKMLVAIETGVATGVFTTRFVQFNSTAETNMSIILQEPIVVPTGVRVRVTMSNRDNQAQDLYSTISGSEV